MTKNIKNIEENLEDLGKRYLGVLENMDEVKRNCSKLYSSITQELKEVHVKTNNDTSYISNESSKKVIPGKTNNDKKLKRKKSEKSYKMAKKVKHK